MGYLGRRLLMAVMVAFAVSVIAFSLLHVSGDLAVVLAGEAATPQQIALIRTQYGLDQPLWIQYGRWLSGVLHGDLGHSMYYASSVADLIVQRFPNTLKLSLLGMLVALAFALPLGIASAVRPNSWIDNLALNIAVFGQAMPGFWLGLMLILVFGVWLRVMPISGSTTWLHFIMPAFALGYYSAPPIMRLVRSGMIEALGSDYIRTAHAKGLPPVYILLRHALRNSLVPVVAVLSVQIGHMLSGSLIIESVFAVEGIGHLAWESIVRHDFPVVQALMMMVACLYVVLVLFADYMTAWLDPRIRLQG